VALPVTVRTTKTRRLYQIHANPRQPENMQRLAAALQTVNARKIRHGTQLIVFEVIGLPEPGS